MLLLSLRTSGQQIMVVKEEVVTAVEEADFRIGVIRQLMLHHHFYQPQAISTGIHWRQILDFVGQIERRARQIVNLASKQGELVPYDPGIKRMVRSVRRTLRFETTNN
ncbi:hypothetical protein M9H77_17362 [Catharanthus roseus]|uniref:Uncharacterized protein n=1 Tax=Catharanthus roseus TaxID=4058 RepID=A0ACC0B4F2_CATRO|nr:hypothetical protein M9H77_17362 [Catharanthus roseus]